MVFKPINLARSVISKTFPNGYAQSLVAATQTSSASHNTHLSTFSNNVVNYFGKVPTVGPSQTPQHAPHSSHGGPAANIKSDGSKEGLDAYYAAWQKHHRAEDKEWHQFQFAKRIGWKAPTTIPDAQPQVQPKLPISSDTLSPPLDHSDRPAIHRAQSASVAEDIKLADQTAASKTASAQQHELNDSQSLQRAAETTRSLTPQQNISQDELESTTASVEPLSPAQSTLATSVSDIDQYTDHLAFLAESQRHAEIPAVFESMLNNGVKPTPTAYNALLLAAIHLPKGKHQVIPKVLDVYSDMLRRHVAPDTATYAVLVEVLAARALHVQAMSQDLSAKQARYSSASNSSRFLLGSDATEYKILSEDDSLSLAIRLFDTSAAVTTNHSFPAETYRLLVTACARHGRINDMVRIYAEMESQDIVPPTAIFAPMIEAFSMIGDLRSAVECYEEYKALAVAHDNGLKTIVRRDEDIYAALVKAYAVCDQASGGLKFLAKLEESLQSSPTLPAVRDAIATQALIPTWIAAGAYTKATTHAMSHVSAKQRVSALEAICVDAADHGCITEATEAFGHITALNSGAHMSSCASALMISHLRNQDVASAQALRQHLTVPSTIDSVEPAILFAFAYMGTERVAYALSEVRQTFARVREGAGTAQQKTEAVDRIDEAISVLGQRLLETNRIASAAAATELLQIIVDNGTVSNGLAEHLLAPLGPKEISAMSSPALTSVMHVQAGILAQNPSADVGHLARFAHVVELIGAQGIAVDAHTGSLVEKVLSLVQRTDLSSKWQNSQYPTLPSAIPAAQFSPVAARSSPAFDANYDPYASTTDFKGSAVIADELEKSQGRHASHLSDALTKFKNMRRIGRHPRYITYAKLIAAAAKEHRLELANDILAMARQDVPMIPGSRIVTHGWISIFDSMVGACLTVGKRDIAAHFHQELLAMGAAPSANTFGLYITTLKDSTKTFDEATEAVKIFHRAKTEGVEPTSFLYNALIGKLGKARRIDDCLFYFAEMRNLGIRPTSVTYGTIVNALCRVSDDKFAEDLFEEMESMPNYKPRPAPYNSLMQYFLTTKRDRSKVLAYYERMLASKIEPTMHTYKLLIDAHATLEPVDMPAAEKVLSDIRASGAQPEAVHYASLIHAKGCVMHDLAGARATFDSVIAEGRIAPQASLYQAIFESMVANHDIEGTESLLKEMSSQRVGLTPYIANTLIHGWALVKDVNKARAVYDTLGMEKREPSTYEAMTRAYLAVEEHGNAVNVVGEALRRGYPSAVANKICDLVGGG